MIKIITGKSMPRFTLGLLCLGSLFQFINIADAQFDYTYPLPQADEYVHQAPDITELLEDSSINPKLKETILRGFDLFMNTQQLRGQNVFNDLNCRNCHLGQGARAWSGPIWPAVITLPDFRSKNGHVNSLEERIAGCFVYSMNGTPPDYGSDDMLALVAYHQWLAKGAQMYDDRPIYGRGFSTLGNKIPQETSVDVGKQIYLAQCAVCHGENGEGVNGQNLSGERVAVFPALWGKNSYNWGAGMSRVPTLASFLKYNMPYGKPGSLKDQEAWDLALFIDSQERPQDPRYTGDAKQTREQYKNFHGTTMYGTEFNGKILGQHDDTGEKPFLKPEVIRERNFSNVYSDVVQ